MTKSSTVRRSMTSFLFVAVLMTGAVSCKKDNDSSPGSPTAQRIKEFKTGDEFMRFDYNVAGEVSKVVINSDVNTGGTVMTYIVTYDGAKKIASLETDGQKIVPVYENNLLKRADLFEGNDRIGYTNYQFENGLLKRATIYFGEDDDFIPALEFDFTHNAAGNISETVVMMATAEPGQLDRAGHIEYQYDQKSNPLYGQRDLLALFWQGASKNNIKVEDHFDSNLQQEDKLVYAYEYNNNGFPKAAIVTQGLPGQSTTTNSVSFTYQ